MDSGHHPARSRIGGLQRRLQIEHLEDRRLLSVVTVDTDLDVIDFGDGVTSLREAIFATNTVPGADEIVFDFGHNNPATILLDQGELQITDELTILGPDEDLLTIDASGSDPTPDENNGDGSRIFNIDDGDDGTDSLVTISGLTLTGGDVTGDGGAIRAHENLTVTSSTISGNSAVLRGGGIYAWDDLIVTASTISGNSADDGGGISGDNVTVTSSTITGNQATNGGGGIWAYSDTSTAVLSHTIVAGNSRVTDDNPPVADDLAGNGTFELGYSLVDTAVGAINTTPGTINYFGVDPLLGPLQDNGGPTETHALLPGSPAIDAGDPLAMAGIGDVLEFDQRGEPYIRVADGDGDGIARIDIGAFEVPDMFVVDTLVDESDGDFSQGDLSLREAIGQANASPQYNNIVFDPGLFDTPQILPLTMGEIEITEVLTVNGPGKDLLTIDAQQQSRIFNITVEEGDYTIVGMTLTGGQTIGDNLDLGDSTFSGGAIRSLTIGNLTLIDSLVSGNCTYGRFADGGGIFSDSYLTVIGSTISGNSTMNNFGQYVPLLNTDDISAKHLPPGAAANGGGIQADNLFITNSTITGNFTLGGWSSGGGISTDGDLVVVDSTVSGNSTSGENGFGGGIYTKGSVSISNCIISSNFTTGSSAGGGGIYNRGNSTSLTITDSSISGNFTTGSLSMGGGIAIRRNELIVSGSTIDSNFTTGIGAGGGGIWVLQSPTVMISDSTISGNAATGYGAEGGGIRIQGSISPTIVRSTITDNSATASAGGILAWTRGFTVASHSIVSGNWRTPDGISPIADDLSGNFELGYSLVGDNSGTSLLEAPIGTPDSNGNLIGGPINGIIDPLLGPLADNGGPTQTHALLPNSPAIDAGDPTIQQDLNQYDQRGHPFVRVADGDLLTVIAIDMGAYEAQIPPSADFDSDHDVDGSDFLAWQRGYGITVGATRTDGNSDDDEDVDASDLAAWDVSFGDGVSPLVSAQSTVGNQSSPPWQKATAPTLNLRAELIDAALALATAGHQALPKEGAVVVEDGLNLEAPYEAVFARHDPLPTASASSLGISLFSEGDEQEEGYLDEVVDRALASVFG